MINEIMQSLQQIITKYGLELLQHYADDLLVIDREIFAKHAHDGARIAWMVGHRHTHTAILGVHPMENECVTYHTNLSNDDRFFLLTFGSNGRFSVEEKSREAYAELSKTQVIYSRDASADLSSFWVKRHGSPIGHISLTSIGTWQQPKEAAQITPVEGITARDRAALLMWCEYGVRQKASTQFVSWSIEWNEPVGHRKVA